MSDIARSSRSRNQRWAAPGSAHDRMIAVLQIVLPMGIGILGAFLVLAPMFTGGDVSFVLDKNKVAVASERLKIQTARYRGEDSKGRPFALTAGQAVQKSLAEPIVQLSDLAASIDLQDGPAQLTADRGRYDMSKEQVAIDGPIRFTAANGYVLGTRDATVDLKTRRLASAGAVSGSTPLGTFSGDQLMADLEARTVALKGNARLRIVPRRAK
ncbi:LPS export ABC transporter periplasmic protein LptC [Sphingomonas sp.]|uniref:LPS export ABC transporter periplasmic protein LptC n=1 Tax=Sphingomonas sp. TaxID=28214 RepID=UPI002C7740E0|nr:LPS export ABC transporter periplasmic protein LptC [Sphingomonas sp.]HWK37261.1 LPS export ABC transporter periplasmic protein LptC [Sphingomonas sp.]